MATKTTITHFFGNGEKIRGLIRRKKTIITKA